MRIYIYIYFNFSYYYYYPLTRNVPFFGTLTDSCLKTVDPIPHLHFVPSHTHTREERTSSGPICAIDMENPPSPPLDRGSRGTAETNGGRGREAGRDPALLAPRWTNLEPRQKFDPVIARKDLEEKKVGPKFYPPFKETGDLSAASFNEFFFPDDLLHKIAKNSEKYRKTNGVRVEISHFVVEILRNYDFHCTFHSL